ncbi:MAG: hypothetical protein M3256_26355 [Actinomycetota bacterium]|nr:hypothetical protein [Actinomycetota bacterium]
MEAFQDTGTFWLPERPERSVSGTLSFDPVSGCRLELIGALFEHDLPGIDHGAKRVVGVANRDLVTLEECLLIDAVRNFPGGSAETWSPAKIFRGMNLTASDELNFDQVYFELDGLLEWIGQSGLQRQFIEEAGEIAGVVFTYRRVPGLEVAVPSGERLELRFSWATSGDSRHEATVRQYCSLGIRWPEPVPLEAILRDVKAFQDLLTMAIGRSSDHRSVVLHRPDMANTAGDNIYPQAIEFFASSAGARASGDEPIGPHKLLFSLTDLGGIGFLARWLVMSRAYRAAVNSLLSIRHQPGMYAQNRFANAITAAETLHRLKFPGPAIPAADYEPVRKALIQSVPPAMRGTIAPRLQFANEPFLSQRLKDLLTLTGQVGEALVGGKGWARIVTAVRNRLTHLDADEEMLATGEDMYYLAESLYVVVVVCLLIEAEAPDEALNRVAQNQTVQLVASHLPEMLERLAPMLQS